jgi:tetratricopeptide (TPR) repeat protein
MANSRRKSLIFFLLLWIGFVVVVGEMILAQSERIVETTDVVGFDRLMDELRGSYITAVLAVVVLVPLFVVLQWHGALVVWPVRWTRAGQAAARNQNGLSLFRQGRYMAAIAEFTEAVQLNPDLAAAYANRGICFFHLDRLEEALADLDRGLCLDPRLSNVFGWRGQVWFKKGDSDRALDDYNEALRLKPTQPAVLSHRARIWLQRQDRDRALEDINRAIALDDEDGHTYFARGSLLLARDDCSRAVADFNQALFWGLISTAVYSNRGMAWLGLGDCRRAIADFDEAIRLDPLSGLALNNRGAAFLKAGNYTKAVADFKDAIERSPELANSYKNLGWLLATCPQPEFRDGGQAVGLARKALELVDWKEAAWLGILAAACAEAGDFEEAIRWQTQCLEESPPLVKEELRARLGLYRAGQPYRDVPVLECSMTDQPLGPGH